MSNATIETTETTETAWFRWNPKHQFFDRAPSAEELSGPAYDGEAPAFQAPRHASAEELAEIDAARPL